MRLAPVLLRLLLALAGVGVGPQAAAAERTVDFDLPAQSAAQALLAFSRLTQIEVLFSFDALRAVQSAPVTGKLAPAEALARLLRGTGFVARPNGRDRFVIGPAAAPTGALRGRLLTSDGTAIAGARLVLPPTHHTATTDARGDFEFRAVTPGTHRLVASADGFRSLEIAGVVVEADHTRRLDPQRLQPSSDPASLAPFLVRDHTTRENPFDRSETRAGPRGPGDHLDLARTENDAIPYTIHNRDQIARSGVVNLNEFLQREVLDSDAATRPPEQDGGVPAFLAGSTNVNLRGFGSDQTIVLVNGRRLPEALVSGSPSQTPDVNFIPLSLVQQIEVLPLSAAALYSGNAVGGIVNIVLRPAVDSDATEVSLTYTNALARYDAPQSSAAIMHSRALFGGALRVRFNASLTQTVPPTETELGYRQRRRRPDLSPTTSLYRATPNIRSYVALPENPMPGDPPPVPPPLSGLGSATFTSVAPGADGRGGLAAFAGRAGVRNWDLLRAPGGLASSTDSLNYPYGREQERSAYFASVVYDVAPWLQLGLDSMYTRTVIHRGYDVIAADLRMRATAPGNPFGQDIAISLLEFAPRLGEHYSRARLEFGSGVLSALFKLPRGWTLLADGQYGRNLSRYRGLAGADSTRWEKLIDEGRYNPLRDPQVLAPPQEFYDQVLIYRGGQGRFITVGDYTTIDASVRLGHRALALPTGTAAVNLGADYRHNALARHLDERRFADGTLAADPVLYLGRAIERYSIFGEVQAPLLPDRWRPVWLHGLEGDFAVRYIASRNTTEANVAPTLALKARLPGGLAFRGSVSTSSRYPTPQLSRVTLAPPNSRPTTAGIDFRQAYDPTQKLTITVSEEDFVNPFLLPEDALTQTAGLIWRRGTEHRFRAALDFVETRKVNELVTLDVQTVLNLEHLFPDRVIRRTEADAGGAAGTVRSVITGAINSASRRSHNWNLSLDYAWTKAPGGTLEAYGRLLYFTRYDHLLLPGARVVDELAHPEGGGANVLRYRAKFGAAWSARSWGLGVDGHYFHSRVLPRLMWDLQGRDRVRPYWQCDAFVQGSLSHLARWLPRGLRAQLRVNNVFGEDFPAFVGDPSGAGVQTYGDWRKRTYSLSLTTAF
ncbi:MAG: carboxypeptidase regulatory-like domain-containing protein [Opitutaceae bacterium]|nr:carboxypeptidase regulatory-like domain-containing protein [Opitutaceae bacterium]